MNICWFNGPSAELLAYVLPPQDLELGCNHFQTVRPVHYICAYDQQVVESIKRDPSIGYYTRAEHASLPYWKPVTDPLVRGINSGLLSVIVATHMSKDPIFILGCDWGLSVGSIFKYKMLSHRKYTNAMRNVLKKLSERNLIFVVNDAVPDVPVPIIKTAEFLTILNNNR